MKRGLFVFVFVFFFSMLVISSVSAEIDDGLVLHYDWEGSDFPEGWDVDLGEGIVGENSAELVAPEGLSAQVPEKEIENADNSDFSIPGKEVSIALWVKREKLGLEGIFSYGSETPANSGGMHLWFTSTDNPRFSAKKQSIDISSGSHETVVPGEGWVHLAVTVDNSGKTVLYKNGEAIRSFDFPEYGGDIVVNTSVEISKIYLGSINNWEGSPNNRHFDGNIDDIRVYNRSLSEQEVLELSGNYNPDEEVSDLGAGDQDFNKDGSIDTEEEQEEVLEQQEAAKEEEARESSSSSSSGSNTQSALGNTEERPAPEDEEGSKVWIWILIIIVILVSIAVIGFGIWWSFRGKGSGSQGGVQGTVSSSGPPSNSGPPKGLPPAQGSPIIAAGNQGTQQGYVQR